MVEENNYSEVLRLMEVVVQKVDGLASDVRTNTYAIDRVENKVDQIDTGLKELRSDFTTLSGRFSDVGVMAIKDHKRVDALEQRVDILEQKPH